MMAKVKQISSWTFILCWTSSHIILGHSNVDESSNIYNLRTNVSLYVPFLHYYDIAFFRSDLIEHIDNLPLPDDLLHMKSLVKALPFLGQMLFQDAPLPIQKGVEAAEKWITATKTFFKPSIQIPKLLNNINTSVFFLLLQKVNRILY